MAFIRYSLDPPERFTFKLQGKAVGLGAGMSADDPGFWNLVWLTCPQVDLYHLAVDHPKRAALPYWSPEFEKPFIDTANFELSGIPIKTLAATLTASWFMAYLAAHPDGVETPLFKLYGKGWLVNAIDRAKGAANVVVGSMGVRPPIVAPQPADERRLKIASMGDWTANLSKPVH